jgi:hypothetical protein
MSYIGNQPLYQAFLTDQFNGTGSLTTFTMSVAPANPGSVLVVVSGVLQDPTTYSVSGTTLTFTGAPPAGTANISVRYMGIPASGVTTTAYRTVTEFTATAGQTTFTPPSYTVGFIAVYRNGVRLGAADYTASNGTTVVLALGASVNDLVVTESFYVSSVVNAIPNTAGAVNTTNIVDGGVTQSKLATGVAGNGPAFSAYQTTGNQSISSGSATKVQFQSKEFDTASCFDNSTNYRFTPNVAGYYDINAQISYSSLTATEIECMIYKNGSQVKRGMRYVTSGASYATVNSLVYMNGSTDYVEIYTYQTSGSSILLENLDFRGNYFQGHLARSA